MVEDRAKESKGLRSAICPYHTSISALRQHAERIVGWPSPDARMSLISPPPPLGHPVPAGPHATSVQLDTWKDVVDAVAGALRMKEIQQSGYPRSLLHQDIRRVSPRSTAPLLHGTGGTEGKSRRTDHVQLQDLCARQFATTEQRRGMAFWRLTGCGISSRPPSPSAGASPSSSSARPWAACAAR